MSNCSGIFSNRGGKLQESSCVVGLVLSEFRQQLPQGIFEAMVLLFQLPIFQLQLFVFQLQLSRLLFQLLDR